jgi:hypothetical protein
LSAHACADAATLADHVSGGSDGLAAGTTAARAALCAAVIPTMLAGSGSPVATEVSETLDVAEVNALLELDGASVGAGAVVAAAGGLVAAVAAAALA